MSDVNLLNTMDANIWAEEWMKTIKKHPEIPTDEGTMLGWFANAIMAGYDKAKQEDDKLWQFLEQHKYDLIFDSGLQCWLVVAMESGGVVAKVLSRASAGTSPELAMLDALECLSSKCGTRVQAEG